MKILLKIHAECRTKSVGEPIEVIEVLHLTFPCMEFFFHAWKFFSIHGKKNSMDGEKRFPWQSEIDLATYRDVPEVFTTSYKGVT